MTSFKPSSKNSRTYIIWFVCFWDVLLFLVLFSAILRLLALFWFLVGSKWYMWGTQKCICFVWCFLRHVPNETPRYMPTAKVIHFTVPNMYHLQRFYTKQNLQKNLQCSKKPGFLQNLQFGGFEPTRPSGFIFQTSNSRKNLQRL